ncbi:SCO family protein [Polyangium spumosum]|uniref:SCO family protein n=2 Tax=Polyangium spumosum TaxID=889282 RepID=A0A6N7PXD1_9BACT|nr:SCO family protein [Polyangium spumosum]
MFFAAALTAAVVTLAPASRALAGDPALPKELVGVDIEERPGADLPADVKLRDQEGRDVTLGSYLDGEHPVILVLAYYECPMLCTLVVNGLMQGMKGLDWTAGKEYRVVVVSFDPRDTPEMARKKRDVYVGAYGRPVGERGWEFLVGEEAQVRRLADAVGFRYRWEEATQQYAHAAGAFVFTPEGKLSRTLYGLNFASNDLKLSLLEASQGKLATAWGRVLLFCFHYDSGENKYVLATRRLMKAGGAFTVLGLGGMLLGFWRRERRRASKSADGALA